MTSNQMNRDQLSAAADAVGQRVAEGETPAGEVTAAHVQALQAAGIPSHTIAQLLRAGGTDEEDVVGYLGQVGVEPPPPSELILFTLCIGTCRSITLIITTRPRQS